MNIELQVDLIAQEKELRHFVQGRVDYALGRHRHQIACVRVRVGAVYEPQDLKDKGCQVQVSLPGHSDIVVENQDSNIYIAVHRAVDRAGWTVARCLERSRRRAANRVYSGRQLIERREPNLAA